MLQFQSPDFNHFSPPLKFFHSKFHRFQLHVFQPFPNITAPQILLTFLMTFSPTSYQNLTSVLWFVFVTKKKLSVEINFVIEREQREKCLLKYFPTAAQHSDATPFRQLCLFLELGRRKKTSTEKAKLNFTRKLPTDTINYCSECFENVFQLRNDFLRPTIPA
jgi:hypothetical protein